MKFVGGCEGILGKYCRIRTSHLFIRERES
jgi:hypothetical protein